MKYRCSHCHQIFELAEKEFHRCPNCFWTTSLVPLEEGSETSAAPVLPPAPNVSHKEPAFRKFAPLFIILPALAALTFILIANWDRVQSLRSFFPTGLPKESPKTIETGMKPFKVNPEEAQKLLTSEERAQLVRPFQITIPRQMSEDEEEILKKQVAFPAKLSDKPKLTPWAKEDFEKMLESEQKQRKILLGWLYVRSVTKVFDENYPAAVRAFEKGNFSEAREFFVQSLAFPIYHGDLKLHRAVVLVMLRPYINDVIGKIATLNQYMLSQTLAAEAQAIFESYQALFPIMELHEWGRALEAMNSLKEKIAAFEGHPQGQVQEPNSLREIDPEIQSAIRAEAAPRPEGAVSLKALSVDLDLKEKIIRQNTSEELSKIQKQYEQALGLLERGNWQEAESALRLIEYPPELVTDARQKLAILEKAAALQENRKKPASA